VSISAEQRENSLLAALPDPEWRRLEPLLEQVDMPLGQVLYESGATLTHVYFPTTSIVSLLYVMENGASAEIAVVGKEGLVGVSLFMIRKNGEIALIMPRSRVRVPLSPP